MSRDRERDLIPPDKLALYDRLIATRPDVERKGAALPYTSVNGHMFSFLSASGALALRLPAEEREEFIRKHRTALAVAHGAVLKEYVAVPAELFHDTPELKKYFDRSFDYVSTLKPKQPRKNPGSAKRKSHT